MNLEIEQLAKELEQKAEADKVGRILIGVVAELDKKILLIQRSDQDDFLPGYFEIPGGKLDQGENILAGAKREFHEETGLEVLKMSDYIGSFDAISPDGKNVRQFNFLVEPVNNHVKLSSEHSKYIWWNINDENSLNSFRLIEAMKDVIQKAVTQIKKEAPDK